jgi:hypothetical protein
MEPYKDASGCLQSTQLSPSCWSTHHQWFFCILILKYPVLLPAQFPAKKLIPYIPPVIPVIPHHLKEVNGSTCLLQKHYISLNRAAMARQLKEQLLYFVRHISSKSEFLQDVRWGLFIATNVVRAALVSTKPPIQRLMRPPTPMSKVTRIWSWPLNDIKL